MINRQRLTDEFARLAGITSPPLHEGAIARYLSERLAGLGAEIVFDRADQATGGEIGNLIAWFPAAGRDGEPLLMSVHMDTVEPSGDVVPGLNGGVFTSASGTILGADDKAGIAELIEALEVMREQGLSRGPLEVVVTIAEEIGLVGAKHLDYKKSFEEGTAKKLHLEADSTLAIHTDGEIFGPWEADIRQVEVGIVPGAIEVRIEVVDETTRRITLRQA